MCPFYWIWYRFATQIVRNIWREFILFQFHVFVLITPIVQKSHLPFVNDVDCSPMNIYKKSVTVGGTQNKARHLIWSTYLCLTIYWHRQVLLWGDGRRLSLMSLHWRHNNHGGVSNHQPHGCLLNRLFRRWSKKTSKLRVTGLCAGNSPGPVNSPHKGPVTRKMVPCDDVIMYQKPGTVLISRYSLISTGIFIAKMRRSHLYNGNISRIILPLGK